MSDFVKDKVFNSESIHDHEVQSSVFVYKNEKYIDNRVINDIFNQSEDKVFKEKISDLVVEFEGLRVKDGVL